VISRRGFLTASTAAATAAVGAVTASTLQAQADEASAQVAVGNRRVNPHGEHQAGIALDLQAHSRFIAFDVLSKTTKADLGRWAELITDDIRRLTAGKPVLADPTEQFAGNPARLTVTVGFGPALLKRLGVEVPKGFTELPEFKIDRLTPEYSDGDILLHVSADDPITLFHAARALTRDTEGFANLRWVQEGFANAIGVSRPGKTQRNLMGQVDGTDNPEFGTDQFNELVWIKEGPEWAIGGTQLALRRIKMNLDTWDRLSTDQKEGVIGRKLSNGAPLTGSKERDLPNFEAVDKNGIKVIPPFAHIRNAAGKKGQQFFRRPFNYEVPGKEAGLLWTAYCANITEQYVPIQTALDQGDLLNLWTTPTGSSIWVIPRGFAKGETLAAKLFS
jgi:dye decolorizing peroxidase